MSAQYSSPAQIQSENESSASGVQSEVAGDLPGDASADLDEAASPEGDVPPIPQPRPTPPGSEVPEKPIAGVGGSAVPPGTGDTPADDPVGNCAEFTAEIEQLTAAHRLKEVQLRERAYEAVTNMAEAKARIRELELQLETAFSAPSQGDDPDAAADCDPAVPGPAGGGTGENGGSDVPEAVLDAMRSELNTARVDLADTRDDLATTRDDLATAEAALAASQENADALRVARDEAVAARDRALAERDVLRTRIAEIQLEQQRVSYGQFGGIEICTPSERDVFVFRRESDASAFAAAILSAVDEETAIDATILVSNLPEEGVACLDLIAPSIIVPRSESGNALLVDYFYARTYIDDLPDATRCADLSEDPELTGLVADGQGEPGYFWVRDGDTPARCFKGDVDGRNANRRSAILIAISEEGSAQ